MRSKVLLISNILATIYSAYLLWWFGGAIAEAGGFEYMSDVVEAFQILESLSIDVEFLEIILILLCVHVVTFILGCLIGWIAFLAKKSGGAKFSAMLYLLGTICFPIYIVFGLPITIMGFIGGSKQKKINKTATTTI